MLGTYSSLGIRHQTLKFLFRSECNPFCTQIRISKSIVYAALRTDCVVLRGVYPRTTAKLTFCISVFLYRTVMWLHFFYSLIILGFCNKSLGCLGGRMSCSSHLVSCRVWITWGTDNSIA